MTSAILHIFFYKNQVYKSNKILKFLNLVKGNLFLVSNKKDTYQCKIDFVKKKINFFNILLFSIFQDLMHLPMMQQLHGLKMSHLTALRHALWKQDDLPKLHHHTSTGSLTKEKWIRFVFYIHSKVQF